MTTILLILHLMIAAALVGVVLLQRSEGGALGIGGGGGFMTGRGAANFLTRVTASLAAASASAAGLTVESAASTLAAVASSQFSTPRARACRISSRTLSSTAMPNSAAYFSSRSASFRTRAK